MYIYIFSSLVGIYKGLIMYNLLGICFTGRGINHWKALSKAAFESLSLQISNKPGLDFLSQVYAPV